MRLVSFSGLALAAISGGLAKAPGQRVALPETVLPQINQAVVVGAPAGSEKLCLAVGLKPADPAGLQAFADSVSDPKSPNYRHFLTPEQVASQFGAAQSDVNNVVSYLKSNGMTVTLVSRNHTGILATATVAQAQAAFGTTIKLFTGPDPSGKTITYMANTSPVMLPANIASTVEDVAGLANYARPHRHTILTPALARGLYDTAPAFASGFQGQGCSIGISNWDGFRLSNAGDFISYFGLPYPGAGATTNITVVSVDGNSNANTDGAGEGDIDIQMELATAPMANIYIYDSQSSLLPTLMREASDDVCDVLSESYGWYGFSGSDYDSLHTQHTTMTSQGQTYLCASGDDGTADVINYPYPDVDPEVLTVGGTTANVNTTTGARISEVGWNGSGGGWNTGQFGSTSLKNFNKQPSWQTGNGVPNKGYRLVPDVALHAQYYYSSQYPYAAYFFFYAGAEYVDSGTSFASPLCAGALATLEQQLVANGQTRRFGRINDLIYGENGRSDVWYDITSGSSNGLLPDGSTSNVGTGWDTETGWGAPDFGGWYNALAVETLIPTSYSVYRGVLISGNLASLAAVDKNYLSARLGLTLTPGESPLQIVAAGTSGLASASSMQLLVTAHTSTVGLTQVVEAYNWTTSKYVVIDSRNATKTDSSLILTVANPNQYIKSGTKQIQMRIRYYQSGLTSGASWSASIDQAAWKIAP